MEKSRFTEFTPPPTTGLQPYTGSFGNPELRHLLRRTLFGVTKSDMAYFSGKSMVQVVDELLNPTAPLPAPPVKEYVVAATTPVPDNNIAAGSTWVNDINNDGTIASYRRASFKKWWVGNLINQDRSILEKMTLFWHNHFATETNDIGNAQYVYKHHNLLRTSALGNFKTLTRNITFDPAMLVYLNGQYNTAAAPDENYAREIQELFCCGKGPDSLYTEADVKAAAKVFTGWLNNATTLTPYFTASRHDATNKTFPAFYNNTVITGSKTAAGATQEIDDFLNMIFANPEVAKYMCRRLYRWFVYYDIDASVELNVIQPLARVFVASNWEIKPVLDTLFKSEHFFDMANRGVYIKSPFDLVLGSLRTFNIDYNVSDASNFDAQYSVWRYFNTSVMKPMEQTMGEVPNVSGWNAFYQAPSFHEYWINSNTVQRRYSFINTIFNGYYPTYNGLKVKIEVDVIAWVMQFSSSIIQDPDELVNECVKYLLPIDISTSVKDSLKVQNLLSNQTTNSYWTTAWLNYSNSPTNATYTAVVKTRLKGLLVSIAQLAEYQLM